MSIQLELFQPKLFAGMTECIAERLNNELMGAKVRFQTLMMKERGLDPETGTFLGVTMSRRVRGYRGSLGVGDVSVARDASALVSHYSNFIVFDVLDGERYKCVNCDHWDSVQNLVHDADIDRYFHADDCRDDE